MISVDYTIIPVGRIVRPCFEWDMCDAGTEIEISTASGGKDGAAIHAVRKCAGPSPRLYVLGLAEIKADEGIAEILSAIRALPPHRRSANLD